MIQAGLPPGSVLGPHLYLLYTADVPPPRNVMLATFADDTALLAKHHDYQTAVTMLQTATDGISQWTKKWKIKINETKSMRVDFALRPHGHQPILIDNIPVPQATTVKYLGVHLDSKLTWRNHILQKQEAVKLVFHSLYWMFNPGNKLSLRNKRTLYVTVLRPIWMYAAPLWGCSANTNIEIIQQLQNTILRKLTGAPW